MEGSTTKYKRDFREKRKVEKYSLWGVCIFELLRLDFQQFQHDFRSFSDKKGHYYRGQNPSVGGGGGQHRGWGGGALTPPVYMLQEVRNFEHELV